MFTTRNPCQIGPEQRFFGQVFEFYSWGHGTRDELVAIYRAADVAQGRHELVAKEYCAAKTEVNGVLVLSEFAAARGNCARSWSILTMRWGWLRRSSGRWR
jgi:hypothetical protein